MKRKIIVGLAFGAIAGGIDIIPMLIQNLSWDANISAFLMWIIVGFFVSTSNLKINAILKGILISFLVLIPSAALIFFKEPISIIPIAGMTLLLGAVLGFLCDRVI